MIIQKEYSLKPYILSMLVAKYLLKDREDYGELIFRNNVLELHLLSV